MVRTHTGTRRAPLWNTGSRRGVARDVCQHLKYHCLGGAGSGVPELAASNTQFGGSPSGRDLTLILTPAYCDGAVPLPRAVIMPPDVMDACPHSPPISARHHFLPAWHTHTPHTTTFEHLNSPPPFGPRTRTPLRTTHACHCRFLQRIYCTVSLYLSFTLAHGTTRTGRTPGIIGFDCLRQYAWRCRVLWVCASAPPRLIVAWSPSIQHGSAALEQGLHRGRRCAGMDAQNTLHHFAAFGALSRDQRATTLSVWRTRCPRHCRLARLNTSLLRIPRQPSASRCG